MAALQSVCWLDIKGKIETRMLSPVTTYAAYLVYKVAPNAHDCIGPVKTSVRFLGDEVEPETTVVYLKEQVNTLDIFLGHRRVPRGPVSRLPQKRTDGWLEIELGEFFSDRGEGGEVEMRLWETEFLLWKHGLIVEGIEVRPKEKVAGRDAN